MVKNAINLKVLEIAIKKKDYNFLARKLVEMLNDYDWSHEDIVELAQQIGDSSRTRT